MELPRDGVLAVQRHLRQLEDSFEVTAGNAVVLGDQVTFGSVALPASNAAAA